MDPHYHLAQLCHHHHHHHLHPPSHHLTNCHQPNILQNHLAQPWNWPNGQPAAPVRVNEEKGVKRDERGEQIAHHYPITSHNAQCTSFDMHIAFVRCEGLQTYGTIVLYEPATFQVWCIPIPAMGVVCVGMGVGWDFLTHGLPMQNPSY